MSRRPGMAVHGYRSPLAVLWAWDTARSKAVD